VVTNVLSIGDYSDEKNITIEKQTEVFLGEVILCYNYIKQSARRNGVDINEEFYTIYAHGILHLLGFTHSKEMFYLQDIVGKKFII
jgi:rRNA maturation RNase YbeY